MIRSLGLDLSGYRSERSLVATNRIDERAVPTSTRCEIPSVCVLPRMHPELPRCGIDAMRAVWARGLKFPRSARLQETLGRMPAWLAWQAMGQEREIRPTWQYVNAIDDETTASLQGIFQSLVACTKGDEEGDHASALRVVAMPEYFTERPQENLIRSLPWNRKHVRLLWRSVAAVLAWTDSIPPQEAERHEGKRVAVVDVGNAEISATTLELRAKSARGRHFLIPKRDLPEDRCFMRWHVTPFDLTLCRTLLDLCGLPGGLHEVWQLCSACPEVFTPPFSADGFLIEAEGSWAKLSFSKDDLRAATSRALDGAGTEDFDDFWTRVKASCPGLSALAQESRTSHKRILSDALPEWLSEQEDPPCVVLFVGPILSHLVETGTPLAPPIAKWMGPDWEDSTYLPGHDLPGDGVIARGCAIYGFREQAGLPTYLDTLPMFSILGKDRIHWTDVRFPLVQKSEIEGGKEYRNCGEELRNRAYIPRGQRVVRFRLMRQDEEKQLEQTFDTAPLSKCHLSFDVRMRPAQGYARVRITPEQDNLFGGREVVLDWDNMRDPGSEVPELSGPPSFPVCQPILPSLSGFWADQARQTIDSYVQSVRHTSIDNMTDWLGKVGNKLQSGRAYGSDSLAPEIDDLIEALNAHYYDFIEKDVITRYQNDRKDETALPILKAVMRAATALYRRTPAWARDFLEEEFQRASMLPPEKVAPEDVFLNASGRCFSEPTQIKLLSNRMERRFRYKIGYYQAKRHATSLGMNSWCKALQFMLRLNDEAILHVEPQIAMSLVGNLRLLLEVEIERKGLRQPGVSLPFKHDMFTLLFLLRFRARGDGEAFLMDWDEEGTDANRIVSLIEETDRPPTAWYRSGLVPAEPGKEPKSLQSALLNYIKSRATVGDEIIIKEQLAEFLESEKAKG